jgi:hypothetical protein
MATDPAARSMIDIWRDVVVVFRIVVCFQCRPLGAPSITSGGVDAAPWLPGSSNNSGRTPATLSFSSVNRIHSAICSLAASLGFWPDSGQNLLIVFIRQPNPFRDLLLALQLRQVGAMKIQIPARKTRSIPATSPRGQHCRSLVTYREPPSPSGQADSQDPTNSNTRRIQKWRKYTNTDLRRRT